MKKIFVMNLGTTSFKFKCYLFSDGKQEVSASGEIDSVGADSSRFELIFNNSQKESGQTHIGNHAEAFSFCLEELKKRGLLRDLDDLDAVGYKAVHGGRLSGTRFADDELIKEMERVTPLAPAHNSVYLEAIKSVREKYPGLKQAVRFETSFHASIPDFRTTYGVPYEWREELGIRKYGFHGSSHEYIAGKIKELCPDADKVISCHLGGSSSICAIKEGKSVATTMGATPQSGLFNNNRVGDLDVFCIPLIQKHCGGSLEKVFDILSRESGFLGLSGVSNDLRAVFEAMDGGNERARLAVETFADNIVGYIGMYTAFLEGADALVFTGGIGLNSSRLRQMVCDKLGFMGLLLDSGKNASAEGELISQANSAVKVYRIKTDEESVVARNVYALLRGE